MRLRDLQAKLLHGVLGWPAKLPLIPPRGGADNVELDPGSGGAVVKTDDDGTAHWQYVKVAYGADNTQTRVTSSTGLPTDVLDRAARDLGKVDIAAFDVALPAGTNAIGDVGVVTRTSGGGSFFSSIDLDESEEQVSETACTVYTMYFWNATAAPLWAQLFNATAASIAPGTDPPDINFPIPANADSDVAGVVIPLPPQGIAFGTALSVAVTTGSGTNSGAPAANAAGAIIIYAN